MGVLHVFHVLPGNIPWQPLLRKNQILMKFFEGLVKTLVKDIEERRNICLDQANPFHKELQTMLATYK